MDLLTSNVLVVEENRTRADLYALWLDDFDVRVAVTPGQVEDELDDTVAVTVLEQEFADGSAESVLEAIRARAPACRVVATRDRSATFPDLGVDHQLVQPVFEEELLDLVRTLVCQVNYRLALQLYYRTTSQLASLDVKQRLSEERADRQDTLERRADSLRTLLGGLRTHMTDEDIATIVRQITAEADFEEADSTETADSKYRPDSCSNCGREWSAPSVDGQSGVVRLGAYVWRCGDCGHVRMHTDPSHQHIGSYRK